MPIAAFALFLAVPLWAQHGGGGHSGGGHGGGFGGGHGFSGGHGGGGHVSGGMHSGAGVSRGFSHTPSFSQRGFAQRNFSQRNFSQRASSRRPFLHDGFRDRDRDRFRGRNRFRDRDDRRFRFFGFRNNCFGYGCRGYGYPWWGYGYYDPYWWGDSGSSYDEDYERDRGIANDMNAQSLEEQRMREQERNDGDQDVYAQSRPAPREPESAAPQPATVLIFRDQHKQEVQNYAIVGQTLWNFTARTERIPLTNLDLPATAQANDDRGLTFKVPTANEAQ